MTRVFNDPDQFAVDALGGFAAAHARYVQPVFGGVVRSTQVPAGEVALIVGGGSGHYPAFAGWVGPGMAHGAVVGNVFASPSASQVYSVVRAADRGGGVIVAFGNYTGDVLHFGQATERLRAEGIDMRIARISDDIASNTPDNHHDRRGIAGDMPIVKMMGAAIEAGLGIDDVERIFHKANDATRTLGVAFAGCTLPGADYPLFTVPAGQMAVGLGIHGEPGVRDEALGSAVDVADLLVDGVLAEEPDRASDYDCRAIVLLNGLGTVKCEELFVVYRRIADRLQDAGITPVLPEVGEFVTSLDMAGLSLTLTFLDAELEQYWVAPVDTPAFRRGAIAQREPAQIIGAQRPAARAVPPSSPDSRRQAATIGQILGVMAHLAVDKDAEFGDLDAVAGDGDHGQGLTFGTRGAYEAATAAVSEGAGARTTLVRAGEAWAEAAGGTSGALWGSALTAVGGALSDDAASDQTTIIGALRAGASAILRLGGAQVGDKTLVDALVPFVESFDPGSGDHLVTQWTRAAAAATEAAAATAQIAARLGRSRVLGTKSVGTPDPGATSFAALMTAVAHHLTKEQAS